MWPGWFHEPGYAQLMRQLRNRGLVYASYSNVHLHARLSDDAAHFEARLKADLERERELDFAHDNISELWRRCKDTPPGKHTLRACACAVARSVSL